MGTGPARAPAARVGAGAGRNNKKRYGGWLPWLFALPALAVYATFLVYPAATSLFFSLTDWDGLSPTYNIVGLANYEAMAEDPVVIQALVNNLIWTVVTIVVPVAIGLTLAIMLNGKVRGKAGCRGSHSCATAPSSAFISA